MNHLSMQLRRFDAGVASSVRLFIDAEAEALPA
jgi:hypothetical protein